LSVLICRIHCLISGQLFRAAQSIKAALESLD
jgi:hypothetical protein